MPPAAPARHGMTSGPMHKVPCPHCGKDLNFSAHAGEELGGTGWGDQALEVGATIDCDHCDRQSKVAAVQRVTVVKLVRA